MEDFKRNGNSIREHIQDGKIQNECTQIHTESKALGSYELEWGVGGGELFCMSMCVCECETEILGVALSWTEGRAEVK